MTFFHGIRINVESSVTQPSPQVSSTVIGLVGTVEKTPEDFKTGEAYLVDSYSSQQQFKGGTVGDALKAIYAQIKCPTIVIGCTEDKFKPEIEKLKFSQQKTGLLPNIIIAPMLIDNDNKATPKETGIEEALKTEAEKIGAIAIIDMKEDPLTKTISVDSERVVACWPPVLVDETKKPLSPYLAGVIAKNDSERGVHTAFSSRPINGISGLSEEIEYNPFDSDCKANKLNEQKIITVIPGPFKVWGNSGLYSDLQKDYKFISVVRTEDQLKNLMIRGLQWAIDQNITRNLIEEIQVYINNLLSKLTSQSVITGGICWIDKEKNTPEEIMDGKIHISLKWTPSYIAQELTIQQTLTNDYLKEVFN